MTERTLTGALTLFLYGYLTDSWGPFGVLAGASAGTIVLALLIAFVTVVFCGGMGLALINGFNLVEDEYGTGPHADGENG